MTAAQTLAAFRRAALPAIAVGLVAMALVVSVLLSRPVKYQARVGMVATLAPGTTTSGDFGAVVAMNMPAVPVLAVSDSTIKAVQDQVKGAPDPDTLRGSIVVDLVPASSVARVTVTSDNQQTALAVARVVQQQIQRADLLAPVAVLKPIGSDNTSAQLVERDPKLALGLGLVVAMIASMATVVLVQALRPRLLTTADVERVVDEVFEGDADAPPVVDLKEAGPGINLLAAHLLSQAPQVSEVTVVPAGPGWRGDLARQLRGALRTLRVAREVGLPTESYGGNGGNGAPATANGSHNGGLSSTARGIAETGSLPLELLAGSRGPLKQAKRATATATAAEPPAEIPPSGEGFSHLVVTVRLGRTTPVALTTALIALRTHGAGIAGIAVS
jgi:capsular polysaccharide biosynthesis protein